MIKLLHLWFVFLIFSSAVSAKEYYVSTAGNDQNPGTLSNPFRTINKGVSILKPGDILYVRTGTYVEEIYNGQSGTEKSPITIMAYPGESPIIDGEKRLPASTLGSLVMIEGNYVYLSGFEVRNSNGMAVVLLGHHDKASKIKAHHAWENGVLVGGDYGIIEDCQVWQCDLSNSKNPGHPAAGYWSTGISAARSPVDGITTNAILRRNIVYNNWGEGLSSFEAEGTLIEDNIVYDNWSVNLYLSDTRGALVQRNIVYNTPNNIVGQRRPFTLGDEKANKPRSANNTIINNFIYNADLWAFWSTGVPGSGLDNVLIAYNTIVNGQLEIGALSYDQVHNKSGIIRNNIFSNNNGEPWEIKGSLSNLTFSNNLWSALPPNGITGAGDVIGDPQLAKSSNTGAGQLTADYFKLLESSPAINRGIAISSVSEDFFGNTRDASPDIGGNEYNAHVTGIDSTTIDTNHQEPVTVTVIQSRITIRFNNNESFNSISLYNMLGTLVFNHSLTSSEYSTDVSFLTPGVYIIVLSGELVQKKFKVMI